MELNNFNAASAFFTFLKSPIRFRNPMELNNSNAASAFFTFLLFYLFTFKSLSTFKTLPSAVRTMVMPFAELSTR